MILYLLRHGDAEMHSSNGDRSRILTEYGMEQSRLAGRYLKNVHPSVVLLSTYVRAKETLDIVIRESGSCALREFISLDVSPNASVEDLMLEVNAYKEESLLIVGHNPQLSHLIYHLTGCEKCMGNCSFAEIDLNTNNLLNFVTMEEMHVRIKQ